MLKDFKKVLYVGDIPRHNGGNPVLPLFCKVGFSNGNLSISGVVGPKRNGDCLGGCGQINIEFAHRNSEDNDHRYDKPIKPEEMEFAENWNSEKWLDFLDVWKNWHLNDMRAGCKHQRAEKWGEKRITAIEYMLNTDIWKEQNKIKERSIDILKNAKTVQLTAEEQEILSMPLSIKLPDYAPSPEGYKETSRETKSSTWFYEKEHPEGVLYKPCPVCGYKYGSSWLKEEVPQDVIDFLKSLPDASKQPAWV